MKKILLLISILLVISLAAIYIFIPAKFVVARGTTFHANAEGVHRFLAADSNWSKWWPGSVREDVRDSLLLAYNNYDFYVKRVLYNAIEFTFVKDGDSCTGLLRLIPFDTDSVGVDLSSDADAAPGPFSRVTSYARRKRMAKTFDGIVASLSKYASDLKNVYGVDVKNEKVQYQYVVSTRQIFSHYPTMEDVYRMVGTLRNYVTQAGGKELFSPMLNIRRTDSTTYAAQVGLPVDRELPEKDDISAKWMMKGGNILVSEVTGGQRQIEEAQKRMEKYISDYQRSIIAIPFEMLITDRTKQPDSSKWITRIYYPVV